MNVLAELKSRFRPALDSLVSDPAKVTELLALIRVAQDPKFGDYQANFAMPLKKLLGKEPREIAAQVVAAAKLDDVRLHDLRHTFASVMISAGASLPETGKALGHKDYKSTQRYAKLFGEPVRKAAQRAADDMLAWQRGTDTPVTPIRKQGA